MYVLLHAPVFVILYILLFVTDEFTKVKLLNMLLGRLIYSNASYFYILHVYIYNIYTNEVEV